MNLKDIKEMIAIMNENGLTELEIEREGTKIKIRKSAGGSSAPVFAGLPPEYHVETTAAPLPTETRVAAKESSQNVKEIAAPMVGTFYRAPSPEADPFVEVGQIVEIGQVVCIIEAMKLMNEIKSEIRGRIVQVSVENAQPVEFGQTLFLVEPV